MLQQLQNLTSDDIILGYQTCPLIEFFSEDRCLNGCNVSFAVSQIEDCLELNFRYVDYQTLAHLSCSSCVYWISARATRAQRFLSVGESISASICEAKPNAILEITRAINPKYCAITY